MEFIEADRSEAKFKKMIEATEKSGVKLSKEQKKEMKENFLNSKKKHKI